MPTLGDPKLIKLILFGSIIVAISKTERVARAPPSECPVTRALAVGYLICIPITQEFTPEETLSSAVLNPKWT